LKALAAHLIALATKNLLGPFGRGDGQQPLAQNIKINYHTQLNKPVYFSNVVEVTVEALEVGGLVALKGDYRK